MDARGLNADLPHKPLAVGVRTACALLGIGRTTLWGLIGTGQLKTFTIGRKQLVIFSSLESLMAAPDYR